MERESEHHQVQPPYLSGENTETGRGPGSAQVTSVNSKVHLDIPPPSPPSESRHPQPGELLWTPPPSTWRCAQHLTHPLRNPPTQRCTHRPYLPLTGGTAEAPRSEITSQRSHFSQQVVKPGFSLTPQPVLPPWGGQTAALGRDRSQTVFTRPEPGDVAGAYTEFNWSTTATTL